MILARTVLDTSPPRREAFLKNVCGRYGDSGNPVLIAISGTDFLIVSEDESLDAELTCFEERITENLWLLDYAEVDIAYQTWPVQMERLRDVLNLLGRTVIAERGIVECDE